MADPAHPYRAAFPTGPLLDPETGQPTSAWRAFFTTLYDRTGSTEGVSVARAVGTEAAVRAQNDAAIAATAHAETVVVGDAVAREASARQAADAHLQATTLPLTGGTLSGPLTGTTGTFTTLQAGGPGGPTWTAGTVVPAMTAVQGSLYSRQGGGVGATLYVCQGGTIWNAVTGV
jgi:hypothetical protein